MSGKKRLEFASILKPLKMIKKKNANCQRQLPTAALGPVRMILFVAIHCSAKLKAPHLLCALKLTVHMTF